MESNGNIFHKVTLFHILHSRKVVFYLYLAVLAGINSEIIQVGSEKQRYRNQHGQVGLYQVTQHLHLTGTNRRAEATCGTGGTIVCKPYI